MCRNELVFHDQNTRTHHSMVRVINLNKDQIMRAMDYAAAAYRKIQPYSENKFTVAIEALDCDIEYYLRREGDTLTITFRGTDSIRNWITDFDFWKRSIPYDNVSSKIRVHKGFLDAYKSFGVRDQILRSVTDRVRHVKISGHSLGAALSVLCAVDIEYNFPDKDIEVVLFGCPRVGNRAFMKSYNKRVYKTVRVENGNDIVTKVPFAFMGFRHVGARLNIGCPSIPGYFSAYDHYPHRYYSSLYKEFMP